MGGNIIMKYMFFSNTHWPQLTASFYSILFETSICQFNSSNFCPIMPDDVREHLTRDQRHSFIQNHSRSFRFPDPWWCFFSSVHPHSCSAGFRSEDWNGHSRTHSCVVFEVCVWIIVRLEDTNMAHYKISNRTSHLLIFYLLVFDIIHDAMCLNKMSRTSSRNIGPPHQKYSSIFHCTSGVLFIPVFTKPVLSVCC